MMPIEVAALVNAWVEIEDKLVALNRLHARLVRKRESAKWAVLSDYVWKAIQSQQSQQDAILDQLLARWDFSGPK